MAKKLFLSYSIQDKGKIAAVVQKIRQQRSPQDEEMTVVDPSTELSYGDEIRAQIRKNIQDADAVVVVWTSSSANSSWVNYEAGMADALGKEIIVVRPDESAPELPVNLQSVRVLDLKES
jgi:nucleoside 2-deoxyribosyltransferase